MGKFQFYAEFFFIKLYFSALDCFESEEKIPESERENIYYQLQDFQVIFTLYSYS